MVKGLADSIPFEAITCLLCHFDLRNTKGTYATVSIVYRTLDRIGLPVSAPKCVENISEEVESLITLHLIRYTTKLRNRTYSTLGQGQPATAPNQPYNQPQLFY